MDRDAQDLRRLALAHYAVGALTALAALPFVLGIFWGVHCMNHPEALGEYADIAYELDLPPETPGQLLIYIFASITLMVLLHAAIIAWVGKCIANARRYWTVFIFSILDCTYAPFGTIIGVWAVVVLRKPSIKARFGLKPTPSVQPSPPPPPPPSRT